MSDTTNRLTTVTTTVSEYTVNAVPEDHPEANRWEIAVYRRRSGRWLVTCLPHILGRDGFWQYDSPTNRAECEMGEETALRLARFAAPDVGVNGRTASEVADAWRAEHPEPAEEESC